jgi:hypothetical protein
MVLYVLVATQGYSYSLEISSKNITINHIDQGFEPVDTKETQATDPSKRIPDAHSDNRWVILLDLHQRGFPEIHVINIFWHSKVLYNGATCPAPCKMLCTQDCDIKCTSSYITTEFHNT